MSIRVAAETPERTVVKDQPLLMPGFCLLFIVAGLYALVSALAAGTLAADKDAFGIAVALLLGGIGFLYSAQYSEYRFEGFSTALRWRRWHMFRRSSGVIPFADISAVRVDSGPDTNDGTFRIVLETACGDFPLSNAYTANEATQRAVAARIRAALDHPEQARSASPAAE